jgi:predicted nucleotidyltransferase
MTRARIPIPQERLEAFCQKHHIRKLSLFGSVLRDDFRPDSDVDVLVIFDADHVPGFFRLYDIEQELSALLAGRKVDVVSEKFLNRHIRDAVLASAEVRYAA